MKSQSTIVPIATISIASVACQCLGGQQGACHVKAVRVYVFHIAGDEVLGCVELRKREDVGVWADEKSQRVFFRLP